MLWCTDTVILVHAMLVLVNYYVSVSLDRLVHAMLPARCQRDTVVPCPMGSTVAGFPRDFGASRQHLVHV